ncbi:hypothetical protein [Pseudolysinimonas yzui]|uniref:hypothetical protein n=1 Tax=Pseudolysinimonas yzui TaxID=2708254 RepID=UPI00174AF212|nr:hypothetical protein [Pseudolysinimonas yzui]
MRHPVAVVTLTVATLALLSACSPPVTGSVAFTVDGGRLVAIVHMCEGTADEFQIVPEGDVRDGYFERQFWDLPAGDGKEYRLEIGDAAEFAASLDPEVSYSTSAEPDDDSRSARGPNISAADLGALTDGDVFYRVIEPEVATLVGTLEEFRAAACA